MKLTLPNVFTISRAVLAPLFFFLFISQEAWSVVWAAVVFIVAAITDYIDGWLARKYGESSDWGRVHDPLADKVLTTAAFVAFALKQYLAWWMVVLIVVRDATTTYLRSFADSIHKPMATSFSAKSKTFVQLTVIIVVLVFEALLQLDEQFAISMHTGLQSLRKAIQTFLEPSVLQYVMLAVTLFTVWTGAEYFVANRHITRRLCYKILRSSKMARLVAYSLRCKHAKL
jgi:CDP-diacylglycerol--glycerol-3-phosphate 3-phosphatidyltransferase